MKHTTITCSVCNRKLADLVQIDSSRIIIDMAICDSCERQEISMVIQRSSK